MNERLRRINGLGSQLHDSTAAADAFTFGSLHEHVDEVCELMTAGDGHWKAETMDIIIHGYLLLDRHDVTPADMDALMSRRLGRFEEKISGALKRRMEERE